VPDVTEQPPAEPVPVPIPVVPPLPAGAVPLITPLRLARALADPAEMQRLKDDVQAVRDLTAQMKELAADLRDLNGVFADLA
jgi:hypothetical protein